MVQLASKLLLPNQGGIAESLFTNTMLMQLRETLHSYQIVKNKDFGVLGMDLRVAYNNVLYSYLWRVLQIASFPDKLMQLL